MSSRPWNLRLSRRGLTIVITLVTAAVVLACGGAASTPGSPAGGASATTPSGPPTATAAPQVILDQSGSGIASTKTFTVPSSWTLTYTFDCTNFGSQGNFQVYFKSPDGTLSFDNVGPNDLAAKGGNTDYYHTGGTYFMEINSECAWRVIVKTGQ